MKHISKKEINLALINFSKILDKHGSAEIGR